MHYWLIKSEPTAYSLDDLAHDKRTAWTGVRNYQARNYMRDAMCIGDVLFFYHSSTAVPGIVGEATVCSQAYPDPTAFDPQDEHYDATSDPEHPRWYLVDACFTCAYPRMVTLAEMRTDKRLSEMILLRRGNRLSIMPVDERHAVCIRELAL